MKISVFLLFVFISHIAAQTVITVNTVTFFNNNVGGGPNYSNGLNYAGPIFCRDTNETIAFGGPSQPTCTSFNFVTPPLDQGRWGQSALGVATEMSGLGFQGIQNFQVSPDEDFFLGQLTHFNWPIWSGTAASAIDMNILFNFSTPGYPTRQILFTFVMFVDETLNRPPCPFPGTTPCSDKISFNTSFNFNTTFTIGNSPVQYTLILEGFKETNSSTSSAVEFFISNENENSQAFLFARIIESCPSSCLGGGAYVVDANNDCSCDCSNVPCTAPNISMPNCACACPPGNPCTNSGYVNNASCACICPKGCPSPQLVNPDCSCSCPNNYCHAGSTMNPSTCACTCPSTPCAITNQVRNSTCDCICNLTCPSNKVLSTAPGVCGCVCATQTCPAGYSLNQTTCSCSCSLQCPNSVLDPTTCSCGPCQGNWTKNSDGQCTDCPVSVQQSCNANEVYDASSCYCACHSLDCSLQNGTVVDTTKNCSCRPCRAGECICGNGRVEAGEQCDPGAGASQEEIECCTNCQFNTAPCNYTQNLCLEDNFCNGNGTCNPGNYKCHQSASCYNVTCDHTVGICETQDFTNFTTCGGDNLCNSRCLSGVCDTKPVTCAPLNSTVQCLINVCDALTGSCATIPMNDSTPCTDYNPCTLNDGCVKGVCIGQPLMCAAPDQCHNATCEYGTCVPYALENKPCNADDNACTVGDACSGGVCLAGNPIVCNVTGQCSGAVCNSTTGMCSTFLLEGTPCKLNDPCTTNWTCHSGNCVGVKNPATANLTLCGAIPLDSGSKAVATTSIAIFAAIGAATLIGAIIGLAVLLKRIRSNKLLNPDTWNPDMFSSVGSNPLYKGSSTTVDNALFEGPK